MLVAINEFRFLQLPLPKAFSKYFKYAKQQSRVDMKNIFPQLHVQEDNILEQSNKDLYT